MPAVDVGGAADVFCWTTEIHKKLQNVFSDAMETKVLFLNLVKAVVLSFTFTFAFRKTYGGVSAREFFLKATKLMTFTLKTGSILL